jgi:uncharacterized Zn finger protein (UPF0148 family)
MKDLEITCPKCKTKISVSETLVDSMTAELQSQLQSEHDAETKKHETEMQFMKDDMMRKISEVRKQTEAEAELIKVRGENGNDWKVGNRKWCSCCRG